MKRCICVLLLLCMLLVVSGCQNKAEPGLIDCPIPGVAWGMHRDEFLEKFGLTERLENAGQYEFVFTPEELGMEIETITGLPGSQNRITGNKVMVVFAYNPLGGDEAYMRLCDIYLWVMAESSEEAVSVLSKRYGQPILNDYLWGAYPAEERITEEELEDYRPLHYGISEDSLRYTLYPMLEMWPDYYTIDGQRARENGMLVFELRYTAGGLYTNILLCGS